MKKLIALLCVVALMVTVFAVAMAGGDPATCKHSSCRWVTKNAATCTSAGTEWYTCNSCGKALASRNIPKKAHSYGAWVNVRSACHPSGGLVKRTCKCGAYETAGLPSMPHQMGSWVYNKSTGKDVRRCQGNQCPYSETRNHVHNWVNTSVTKNYLGLYDVGKKCTGCGETTFLWNQATSW